MGLWERIYYDAKVEDGWSILTTLGNHFPLLHCTLSVTIRAVFGGVKGCIGRLARRASEPCFMGCLGSPAVRELRQGTTGYMC